MKTEDGVEERVDLEKIRRDYEQWRDVIVTVFAVEAMTTTPRSEFHKIPSKYLAIAQTIGADPISRERENQERIFRFFGAE